MKGLLRLVGIMRSGMKGEGYFLCCYCFIFVDIVLLVIFFVVIAFIVNLFDRKKGPSTGRYHAFWTKRGFFCCYRFVIFVVVVVTELFLIFVRAKISCDDKRIM